MISTLQKKLFSNTKESNFKGLNLLETVKDLFTYGYSVDLPETAEEYREKVYPLIMDMHANAGYWGVQIPVGGVEFDKDGMLTENAISLLKRQREIVENAGLHVSAVGGLWVSEWEQCIKPHIQAANVLGTKFLYGPFATPFLYFPEDSSSGNASVEWTQKRIQKFSHQLQNEIGPFAAEYDVYSL